MQGPLLGLIRREQQAESLGPHRRIVADLTHQFDRLEREKEQACQRLHREIAQLRKALEVERIQQQAAEASHAAMVQDLVSQHASATEMLVSQHATAVEELKSQHATAVEELKSQHALEASNWESALARHASDSNQIKFAVRGMRNHPSSFSVPRSIFQAEPDSALACCYGGDWEIAKDDEGWVFVNSDPANWLLILNWLSFGTVPSNPSKACLQSAGTGS